MQNQSTVIDKKKRTSTSGSRSKSKKSSNNIKHDQTVELKPKPLHIFHNQDICAKIKTQNSLSVNKSKVSRKNSKSFKKPTKGSIKQSKEQSYLVSAERKFSVNKINKTEATQMESEDIFKKLYFVKKQFSKMQIPQNFSIQQLQEYFDHIKQSFTSISLQPLQSIFLQLHSMYVDPIQKIFNMIKPYESMLKRKQEITKLIKQQIQENQLLYKQLEPQDIQIVQLKQKINRNSQLIEDMKKKKKSSQSQASMKKKKSPENPSQAVRFLDMSSQKEFTNGKSFHSEFEMKLGKQYDRLPKFKEQRVNNFIGTVGQNESHQFSQNLSNKFSKSPQQKVNDSKQKTQLSKQLHRKQISKQSQQQEQESAEDEISFKSHHKWNQKQNQEQRQSKQSQASMENKKKQEKDDFNKIGVKSGGGSFNFKLDIPKIDRNNVGFHEQFYSKLDEFSQSWRNQALRQKRF